MNKDHIPRDLLEKMYISEEKTVKEISEIIHASVGKVHKYITKYGLSRPKITDRSRIKFSISSARWQATRPNPRKGVHLSDETKAKISNSHKGRVIKPSQYGGHSKNRSDGYVKVYVPDHPYATKDGYVMEHILAMEKHIGRYITRDEVVHHINHIRNDNRIENLKLMTFREHAAFHMRERQAIKKGVMTYQ